MLAENIHLASLRYAGGLWLVKQMFLKPRLHDTTCCQTGLTTGCIVYTASCKTGCTTQFDNRVERTVCSFNTVERTVAVRSTQLLNRVIQPVWQLVVSCKWGISVARSCQWWYRDDVGRQTVRVLHQLRKHDHWLWHCVQCTLHIQFWLNPFSR